jgi:molybdate transport system substrate-binding protein
LDIIRPVPDDAYPPLVYAAAVSRLARRPNPDAFVNFLGTEDASTVLRNYGLELQR